MTANNYDSAIHEVDLFNAPCGGGLDLSATRDMSAFVLMFPGEDDIVRQLGWHWLPEEYARENADRAPFLQWADDGWLTLTPGNTIDRRMIREEIRDILQRVNCNGIAYDVKYADETTGWLENECGVERIVFPQTMMHFAAPTAEYERLILDHKLRHNGNPILQWQSRHVQVYKDSNGNKRPVKPKTDGVEKIDGIVAGIMALWIAQKAGLGSCWSAADGVLL